MKLSGKTLEKTIEEMLYLSEDLNDYSDFTNDIDKITNPNEMCKDIAEMIEKLSSLQVLLFKKEMKII